MYVLLLYGFNLVTYTDLQLKYFMSFAWKTIHRIYISFMFLFMFINATLNI